jgi:hypothetical protein
MPRYVVLRHDLPPESGRASHWDLMLERDETLRTWALAELPNSTSETEAEALADHRLAYLEYEGPVSNNRGAVTRWDAGTYRVTAERDDELQLEFAGGKLAGPASLTRKAKGDQRWVFRRGST